MSVTYNNQYSKTNVYGHAVHLIKKHEPVVGGVHLDLGCGFGAIAKPIRDLGLTYIGMDFDMDGLASLSSDSFETHQIDLLNIEETYHKITQILNGRSLSTISMLDTLEHITNAQDVLSMLHSIAAKFNCLLIISVPNISHIDISLKLLLGQFEYTQAGLLDHTHVSFYTEKRLLDDLKTAGWHQVEAHDVIMSHSDQHFPNDNILLHEACLLTQYITGIKKKVDPHYLTNQFVRSFLPRENKTKQNFVDRNVSQSDKFLSVIIRTQGKRDATLRDAMLCLSAQSCQDFEVIIVAHKINIKQQIDIETIIRDLPPYMQSKTHLLLANDLDKRGAPLNLAIKQARGHYVSVLDDDDMVFAHWVENFKELSLDNYGKVLRAVSAEQTIEKRNKEVFDFKTISGIKHIYPNDFDLLDHLSTNYTPFMSWSYPRSVFRDLNQYFDETLNVNEDWDFSMRIALLCGVTYGPNITSIYRKWRKGISSYSLHPQEIWQSDHDKVISRRNEQIHLLPAYFIEKLTNPNDRTILKKNLALKKKNLELSVYLNTVMMSRSWRITKPLRSMMMFLRKIKYKIFT